MGNKEPTKIKIQDWMEILVAYKYYTFVHIGFRERERERETIIWTPNFGGSGNWEVSSRESFRETHVTILKDESVEIRLTRWYMSPKVAM